MKEEAGEVNRDDGQLKNYRLDGMPFLRILPLGNEGGGDSTQEVGFITHEVNLSYPVPGGKVYERVAEGGIEHLWTAFRHAQDQVNRSASNAVTPSAPIL